MCFLSAFPPRGCASAGTLPLCNTPGFLPTELVWLFHQNTAGQEVEEQMMSADSNSHNFPQRKTCGWTVFPLLS